MAERDIAAINEQYKEDTESKLKDRIYNWIVDKHTEKGKEMSFSDRFVWKGSVYMVPESLGYLIFIGVFLALAHFSFEKYGEARTVVFFILLVIWRIQVGVKYLKKINSKLPAQE